MLRWYYIWSPKYEIFHRILSSSLADVSGIVPCPIFVPQSFFEKSATTLESEHFFKGNSIKLRLIISLLQSNPGEHIVFSDADLLVFTDSCNTPLATYLESYRQYDLVCMREGYENAGYNIGCMLIKSTPETISFFKELTYEIEQNNAHDQTILNERLPKFKGKSTTFSIPDVVQSNMVNLSENINHLIIQCLSIPGKSHEVIGEKIISISYYFDVMPLKHLLDQDTIDFVNTYFITCNTPQEITSWEIPILL